jgi:hypothetical protein
MLLVIICMTKNVESAEKGRAWDGLTRTDWYYTV